MENDLKTIRLVTNEAERNQLVLDLFCEWHERLLRSSIAHFKAARIYKISYTSFTIFNVIAAISVLFLSASDELRAQMGTELLLPVMSLLVVLISTLQFLLQHNTKSQQHIHTANDFSTLRRKIERYRAKEILHEEALHSLSRSYGMITAYAPLVPNRVWNLARESASKDADRMHNYFMPETSRNSRSGTFGINKNKSD